jgi:hypothetical protein
LCMHVFMHTLVCTFLHVHGAIFSHVHFIRACIKPFALELAGKYSKPIVFPVRNKTSGGKTLVVGRAASFDIARLPSVSAKSNANGFISLSQWGHAIQHVVAITHTQCNAQVLAGGHRQVNAGIARGGPKVARKIR